MFGVAAQIGPFAPHKMFHNYPKTLAEIVEAHTKR